MDSWADRDHQLLAAQAAAGKPALGACYDQLHVVLSYSYNTRPGEIGTTNQGDFVSLLFCFFNCLFVIRF
jgi:hypothetical protein